MKKWIAAILTMMFVLTMFSGVAMANTTTAVAPVQELSYVKEDNRVDGVQYFERYDEDNDKWETFNVSYYEVAETGEVSYCTQRTLKAPTDVGMLYLEEMAEQVGEETMNGLKIIAQYGYPLVTAADLQEEYPGLTDDQLRYATALAVQAWMYAKGKSGHDAATADTYYLDYKKNPGHLAPAGYSGGAIKHLDISAVDAVPFTVSIAEGSSILDLTVNERTFLLFYDLLQRAENREVRESQINNLATSADMRHNPATNKYEATFTFNLENCSGGYEIDGLPAGATVNESITGRTYTVTVSMSELPDENFKLKVKGSDSRSSAKIHFYVAEENASEYQIMLVAYDTAEVLAVEREITIKPTETYIEFTKFDSNTNKPLAGATVKLYNPDGREIASAVSDANGKLRYDNLPAGAYIAKETEAPSGYILNTQAYNLTIAADGSVTGDLRIPNTPVGTPYLYKVDESGKALSGAVFAIYDSSNNKVMEVTSGTDGRAYMQGLTPGSYTYKEIKAPTGYALSDATYEFKFLSDGSVTGVTTVRNSLQSVAVRISKTDLTTSKPVPGATVEIYDSTGKQVYKAVTGTDGYLPSVSLNPGKYTFKETLAPSGYALNPNTFEFTVNMDGTVTGTTSFQDALEGTGVQISKTDLTTSKPVPGATVEIYDSTGKQVYKAVTATNGYLPSVKLDAGTYTFKETLAPSGYALNPSTFSFTVKSDGSVTGTTHFTDDVVRVPVKKVDASKTTTVLEGATFSLYSSADNKLITSGTTDKTGMVTFVGMAPGKYYIKETTAPKGYALSNEIITFEVTATWQNPTTPYVIRDTKTVQTGDTPIGLFIGIFTAGIVGGGAYLVMRRKKGGSEA